MNITKNIPASHIDFLIEFEKTSIINLDGSILFRYSVDQNNCNTFLNPNTGEIWEFNIPDEEDLKLLSEAEISHILQNAFGNSQITLFKLTETFYAVKDNVFKVFQDNGWEKVKST